MVHHMTRWGTARRGTCRRLASRALALLAVFGSVVLAACASTSAPTDVANCPPVTPPAATSAAATSGALATPTLLYQADWSRGLVAWQASPGWSVVNGALESDTGDGRVITVPYLPPTAEYQVIFSVQILSIPRSGGQFALRTAPQGCDAGFDVGVVGLRVGSYRPNGDHPISIVYLDPQGAQDTNSARNNTHDYEPGSSARTYAVSVQGAQATFFVDGHYFGSANSGISTRLAHSPIRLTCSGVAIRVSTLRILTV